MQGERKGTQFLFSRTQRIMVDAHGVASRNGAGLKHLAALALARTVDVTGVLSTYYQRTGGLEPDPFDWERHTIAALYGLITLFICPLPFYQAVSAFQRSLTAFSAS